MSESRLLLVIKRSPTKIEMSCAVGAGTYTVEGSLNDDLDGTFKALVDELETARGQIRALASVKTKQKPVYLSPEGVKTLEALDRLLG